MDHKLCFVGDTGKASRIQEVVAEGLRQEKCHKVFVLGDIIYRHGIKDAKDPQLESKFFAFYKDVMQSDHKPTFYMMLGNHDYDGNPDAWIEVSKLHSNIYAPARYYVVKENNVCLTILDTTVFDRSYPENRVAQSKWIMGVNKELKNCPLKIALGHHPYNNPGPNHGSAEGALREFYDHHVIGKYDALISGHEHVINYVGSVKDTHLIISGAGGALAKNHLPGYVTVEWIQKIPQLRVVRIQQNGNLQENIYPLNKTSTR